MAYATPSLDGIPVFGLVTKCTATAKPVARQRTAFFGQNGELSLYGGSRGYHFMIEGVFQEDDIGTIQDDFGSLLSFVGPATHTYIDSRGNQWFNVIFDGNLTPDPAGPHITDVGWCQAYTMTMESLL